MVRLIVFMIAMMLLASCGGHTRHMQQPVTTSPKIQNPYTVNGVRYEPLSSHEGFVQSGIASWYGTDFHGKTTSNGEKYDMNAMTAAHKTLPFGVYIKVTNRDNGHEAIVRVNDRGPFVSGRIVDLSYSAARTLGVVSSGTAPVKIEALGYLDKTAKGGPSYRPPVSYDRGSFGIQVGAFSKPENAQRLSITMKQRYGASSIKEAVVNGVRYYRVRAGNYTSLKEAELIRSQSSDRTISGGSVVALD